MKMVHISPVWNATAMAAAATSESYDSAAAGLVSLGEGPRCTAPAEDGRGAA